MEYIDRDDVLDMLKRECSPKVFAYLADQVNAIPAADVRPVEWIPVTERLPDEYVNVLCHLRSLDRQSWYFSIDHLMEDGCWWKATNSWTFEVTHWMPLPQPPEES